MNATFTKKTKVSYTTELRTRRIQFVSYVYAYAPEGYAGKVLLYDAGDPKSEDGRTGAGWRWVNLEDCIPLED